MRVTTHRALLLVVLSASLSASGQQLPLKPGQYEITQSMMVRGQPIAPEKKAQCFSQDQLASAENVFNVRPMAGFCKVGSVALGGGKIGYTADCPNSAARVEGTVGADSYSVVRTLTPKSAKGAEVVTRFEGKWVGKCK